MPVLASGVERAISLAYGPQGNICLGVDRGSFGSYFRPIWQRSATDLSESGDYGAWSGLQYRYAAFSFKAMECLADLGAGFGLEVWETSESGMRVDAYGRSYPFSRTERTMRKGLEFWLQPEFRFYRRFSVLLAAHSFAYIWQRDPAGGRSEGSGWSNPGITLDSLRIGVRFYFPFGHKD